MVAPRTPNYVLTDTVVWQKDRTKTIILEAGSFVRPLHLDYVPAHVRDRTPYFDVKTEVYCYTRYGIVKVPINSIRET